MEIKQNYSGEIADIKSNIAYGKSLLGTLTEGNSSLIIHVVGDSIGNGTNEYVYLLAQAIAAAFPSYNVKYSLLAATGLYAAPVSIQAAGEDRHLYSVYPGSSAYPNILKSSEVVHTSDDYDIGARIALDDWQQWAVGSGYFLAKIGSAATTDWCYGFQVNTNSIRFVWSPTGNIADLIVVSLNIDTSAFVDGSIKWIRAKLKCADPDNAGNYTVKGETSTDGTTWVQAGATYLGAAPTSVHVNDAVPFQISGRGGSMAASSSVNLKVYDVIMRDGIDGPIINPQGIESWQISTIGSPKATTIGGTPTIHIYNGSVAGWGVATWQTYGYAGIPKSNGALLLYALGHNDVAYGYGEDYLTALDALQTIVDAQAKNCTKILITQNPFAGTQTAEAILARAKRRNILMGYAQRKGWGIIDTYLVFLNDSRGLGVLLMEDGVHTTAADGELLILDTVMQQLGL